MSASLRRKDPRRLTPAQRSSSSIVRVSSVDHTDTNNSPMAPQPSADNSSGGGINDGQPAVYSQNTRHERASPSGFGAGGKQPHSMMMQAPPKHAVGRVNTFFKSSGSISASDRKPMMTASTSTPTSGIRAVLPTLSNRLRLSEGLSCVDYLPGFRALAVGSTRQLHILEVVSAFAYDAPMNSAAPSGEAPANSLAREAAVKHATGSSSGIASAGAAAGGGGGAADDKKKHSPQPYALRSAGVFGGLVKVDSVTWYPSTEEASLAFLQPGRSITVFLDALQFKQDGTYLPQQWVRSHGKGKALHAPVAVGGGSTAAAVVGHSLAAGGMTPVTAASLGSAFTAATSSFAGGANNASGTAAGCVSPGSPTGAFVVREQKGPLAKELIELTIETTYARVERIVWDTHNPYTLALSSTSTHFELWQIPTAGDKVYAPQLVLRPPAHNTRSLVRDIAFSPTDPHLIVVVVELASVGQVLLYDRRQVEMPRVIQTTGPGLTAAFHPVFADLLAVCYRIEKTKQDCQIAFWRVSDAASDQQQQQQQPQLHGFGAASGERVTGADHANYSSSNAGSSTPLSPAMPSSSMVLAAIDGPGSQLNTTRSRSLRQDTLQPIDYYATINRLRWRPPSYGSVSRPHPHHHYLSFVPTAEPYQTLLQRLGSTGETAPGANNNYNTTPTTVVPSTNNNNNTTSNPQDGIALIASQLWFATLTTTPDVDLSVWDATSGFFPISAVSYVDKKEAPSDFAWVDEVTIVSVFKKGSEVVVTSLLNHSMEEYPTSSSSHSTGGDATAAAGVDDHSDVKNNNVLNEMRDLYAPDSAVNVFSLHSILPTSAVVSDLFGRSFVVRNTSIQMKKNYQKIMRRECANLVKRSVLHIRLEEGIRQRRLAANAATRHGSAGGGGSTAPPEPTVPAAVSSRAIHNNNNEDDVGVGTTANEASTAASGSPVAHEAAAEEEGLGTPEVNSPLASSSGGGVQQLLSRLFGFKSRRRQHQRARQLQAHTHDEPSPIPDTPTVTTVVDTNRSGEGEEEQQCNNNNNNNRHSAPIATRSCPRRRAHHSSGPLLMRSPNARPGFLLHGSSEEEGRRMAMSSDFAGSTAAEVTMSPPLGSTSGEGSVDTTHSGGTGSRYTQLFSLLDHHAVSVQHQQYQQTQAAEPLLHDTANSASLTLGKQESASLPSGTMVPTAAPTVTTTAPTAAASVSFIDKDVSPLLSPPFGGKLHSTVVASRTSPPPVSILIGGLPLSPMTPLTHRNRLTSAFPQSPESTSAAATSGTRFLSPCELDSKSGPHHPGGGGGSVFSGMHSLNGVQPVVERFVLSDKVCSWVYTERSGEEELFMCYALEWEIGYELALTMKRLRHLRDDAVAASEGDTSQPSPQQQQQQHQRLLYDGIREPTKVDILFAEMMERNARICDRAVSKQNYSVQQQQQRHKHGIAPSASPPHSSSSSSGGSSVFKDPRAQWWRAAAHAWRSHHVDIVITITKSQLEYASLAGDAQYCLVLYVLFCLWWRLRFGSHGGGGADHLDMTTTADSPLDPPVACPLLHDDDTTSMQASGQRNKKGPSSSFTGGVGDDDCTPEQWSIRALQWLESYTDKLYARKLYVPLNELLLVFPEILQKPSNPVQPKAAEIAYEKQMTYVFCGTCHKSELFAQPQTTTTATAKGSKDIVVSSSSTEQHCGNRHRSSARGLLQMFDAASRGTSGCLHCDASAGGNNNNAMSNSRKKRGGAVMDDSSEGDDDDSTDTQLSVSATLSDDASASSSSSGHLLDGSSSNLSDDALSTSSPPGGLVGGGGGRPRDGAAWPMALAAEQPCGACGEMNSSGGVTTALAATAGAPPVADNAMCRQCRNVAAMTCVVCEEVVEGIYYWLRSCGHGGHVHHIEAWLQLSNECPKCGEPVMSAAAQNA